MRYDTARQIKQFEEYNEKHLHELVRKTVWNAVMKSVKDPADLDNLYHIAHMSMSNGPTRYQVELLRALGDYRPLGE
jgi:hypothetical protein